MPKPAKAKAPRRPHLLGVRHHGPGSARAVAAALAATAPDIVLVEGPPEADLLLSYAADPEMVPPVALLAHAKDDPGQAGFWPYAEFSPEWAAIRYALDHGVPVRFIDLPAGCGFALDRARAARRNAAPEPDPEPTRTPGTQDIPDVPDVPEIPDTPHPPTPGESHRTDPIAVLARVAGHDDPERWWEDAVEHQAGGADPLAPFALLAEAMGALREPSSAPEPADPDGPVATGEDAETAGTAETASAEALPDLETAREAHMRLAIDTAYRQGFREVAVVCGAWHVPALAASRPAAEDRAVLAPFAALARGGALPRVKVETTWVPWTYRRLGQASGYGAGVPSPGWYHHLFATDDRERLLPAWFVRVAELFRAAGRPVSPAHVIEAVRHAETLAALRGRPLAGLDETLEAVRAVMCDGDEAPLALVHDDIVVGDRIGAVPATVPAVPLQRDLDVQRKRLSLTLADRKLELDLRKTLDADRSRLFTRLTLLDIPWGTPTASRRGTGTFRETWTLSWQPELAIRVAEAGVWGTTVLGAATAHAVERAACAGSLADLTAVAEQCLQADLPDALPLVMRALQDKAALGTDVAGLAEALPALVRALRYGDVRGTDTAALATVADGLLLRICVGLVPACAGLDADGARDMRRHLDAVHDAVQLLATADTADTADTAGTTDIAGTAETHSTRTADPRDDWYAALTRLAERPDLPGLLTGRAVRLLLDAGRLTAADAAPRMSRALTRGTPFRDAAGWIEGFLAGGGLVLVHDDALLALIDAWVADIPGDAFTDVLPLLRRTFATFAAPERRTLGERLRAPGTAARGDDGPALPFDPARADAALPLAAYLLGAAR